MTRREPIRPLEIFRYPSPTCPVDPRQLASLLRLEDHVLAGAADHDLLSLEAELLWKPHSLTSAIPKKLRCAHGHDQYIPAVRPESLRRDSVTCVIGCRILRMSASNTCFLQ